QMRRVDPTVDLDSDKGDDYTHMPDHGLPPHEEPKDILDSHYEPYRRSFSRDLNQHSAVVLQGRIIDVELGDTRAVAEAFVQTKHADFPVDASERNPQVAEIEDLRGPRGPAVAPLSIKDPRDYFDAQQTNALKALGGDVGSDAEPNKTTRVSSLEAYGSLREIVADIRVNGLIEPIMTHEVAFKV
ncbi:hypothetical protein M569_04823, partial [Genlisea aurea]